MRVFQIVALCTLTITGCAGIDVYNNPDLSGAKTGIPFYAPKPYLLIARTGAKDKPVEISVIYLPDTSKTYYAEPKSGFGSAKMNMSFSNGTLSTFGQETDPKITDLITTLAGVPGALASADKTKAEAKDLREQSSKMPEVAIEVRKITRDLADLGNDPGYAIAIKESDRHLISMVSSGLTSLANEMDKPNASSRSSELIKKLEGYAKLLKDIDKSDNPVPTGSSQNIWSKFASIKSKLASIIDSATPKAAPKPTLTLYEIVFTQSGTKLREVDFIPAATLLSE